MKNVISPKLATIGYSVDEGLITSSKDLGWESIVVKEYLLPPTQHFCPGFPQHDLFLCLSTRPYRIHQVMGEQNYVGIYSKGDFSIVPAGTKGQYRTEGTDHFLQIEIEPEFLLKVARETGKIDGKNLQLIPKFKERNSNIEQIIMMLHCELLRGSDYTSQFYIESLTNALVVNLLRDYTVQKKDLSLESVGLSDSKLLNVTNYINDNIAAEIKLSDLAALAGISQFHFSRLFKKSVGISPIQYLIKQRIERAKLLLKNSELSVTEIALSCGFNSHSHLGKYFRQLTGFSPSEYRVS